MPAEVGCEGAACGASVEGACVAGIGRRGHDGADLLLRAHGIFACEEAAQLGHVVGRHAGGAHLACDGAHHFVELLRGYVHAQRHEDGGREMVERLGGYGAEYAEEIAFLYVGEEVEDVFLERVVFDSLKCLTEVVDVASHVLGGVEVDQAFVPAQAFGYV